MSDAKAVSRKFYRYEPDEGVTRCNVCDAVPNHPAYPHADFCPMPALEAAEAKVEALERAKKVVDEQAEDDGLWFVATTASEVYLQRALRRLAATIEGEDMIAALAAGEVT